MGPSSRERIRAFIAIEVPEAVKEGAAAVQDRLRDAGVDASWSRPEGLHLTLAFLGETGEELVPGILQALSLALSGTERFRLRIEGVGAFPNPAAARVVWLGIAGDVSALVALQAAVERAMAGLGLEREDRPYTPHLTLGRIRRIRSRGAWARALEGLRGFTLPGFDATAVSLVRSELRRTGAVYSELGKVALQGKAG